MLCPSVSNAVACWAPDTATAQAASVRLLEIGDATLSLISYRSDLVSLPESPHDCPRIHEDIDMEARVALLRDPLEVKGRRLATSHTDLVLRYNCTDSSRLVRRLLEMGRCDLTMQKGKIGLFVANKDAEKRRRLTVDACRSNEHFMSYLSVRLVSREVLSKIETPADSRDTRRTMFASV